MKEQTNKYRHEIKYFISKRQAAELRIFLKKNMCIDSNADIAGSYWIRSLYFDTVGNRDYYEKTMGYNIRKKIRLRIYDISTTYVKLELKNKSDNYVLKETVTISREDANKLIKGDSNPLLNYNQKVANKIFVFMHHEIYQPKVIIDYEREAYVYDIQNIRVTLDKNIHASFSSWDLFKDGLSMVPVFNDDIYVLEIKYNFMLPIFLRRALSNFTTQKSQISKYCMGRNILGI
ncbi:polyphosphate polymerase domain-containing protein [Tissierella sp.]|uniref:polyphosphate polymerase domain-containing protein n=1 Tax=Tissierella sp. TaxID=41274 RepID=UPI002862EFFF|nr:polyphosphate polymerase domain-containing protein [Tissierella sp.]MDR7855963.1 polyphosphate polymerase domain-containing protein [Tissierella sp.]